MKKALKITGITVLVVVIVIAVLAIALTVKLKYDQKIIEQDQLLMSKTDEELIG